MELGKMFNFHLQRCRAYGAADGRPKLSASIREAVQRDGCSNSCRCGKWLGGKIICVPLNSKSNGLVFPRKQTARASVNCDAETKLTRSTENYPIASKVRHKQSIAEPECHLHAAQRPVRDSRVGQCRMDRCVAARSRRDRLANCFSTSPR